MSWVFITAALIGAMALAVFLTSGWMTRRKRALVEAGARFGLSHPSPGQKLIVPPVPLIDGARKYHVILTGVLNGYDGAFFDIFVSTGKYWNLQSTVLMNDPEAEMPPFQLRTPNWNMPNQRVRGEAVGVPGREQEMHGAKLTSSDPVWAREVFLQAPADFFEIVRKGKWTIEGTGHGIVVYRWGKRISPRELESYIQQATRVGSEMLAMCRVRM